MEDEDDLLSAAHKGQEDVNLWAKSLKEVRGLLQPPKCGWTIHDMRCNNKGVWEYRDAEKKAAKKRGTPAGEENNDLKSLLDAEAGEGVYLALSTADLTSRAVKVAVSCSSDEDDTAASADADATVGTDAEKNFELS